MAEKVDDCWSCEKTVPDHELTTVKDEKNEVIGRYCKDCKIPIIDQP